MDIAKFVLIHTFVHVFLFVWSDLENDIFFGVSVHEYLSDVVCFVIFMHLVECISVTFIDCQASNDVAADVSRSLICYCIIARGWDQATRKRLYY